MKLIMILCVFLLLVVISVVVNIMLKLTDKKHMLISIAFSLVLSIIFVAVLGIK